LEWLNRRKAARRKGAARKRRARRRVGRRAAERRDFEGLEVARAGEGVEESGSGLLAIRFFAGRWEGRREGRRGQRGRNELNAKGGPLRRVRA